MNDEVLQEIRGKGNPTDVATAYELSSEAYRQNVHVVPNERSNSFRRAFGPKIEPYIDNVPRNFSSNSLC